MNYYAVQWQAADCYDLKGDNLSFYDDIENCNELEREFSELFRCINSVGNLEEDSFDKLIETAIDEGEKFSEWRKSGEPLNKVGIFYKVGDRLIPLVKCLNFFKTKSFEITDFVAEEDFQLEIWCLGEDENRYCLLCRIPFSDIVEKRKLKYTEQVRDDVFLKLKMKMKNGVFSIRLSNSKFEFDHILTGWIKPLNLIFANIKERVKTFFELHSQKEWSLDVRTYDKIYLIGDIYKPYIFN